MRFNLPIFVLLIGVAIGIVLPEQKKLLWVVFFALILTLTCLIIIHFLYQKSKIFSRFFIFFLSLSAIILGQLVSLWHNPLSNSEHYTHRLQPNKAYSLIAEILTPISHNKTGTTYSIRVHATDSLKITGKMLCYFPNDMLETSLPRGKKIYISGVVSALNPPKNPKQFDYSQYMKQQGIYWRITPHKVEFLELRNSFSIFYVSDKLRKHLAETISSLALPKTHTGLLKALLLGIRSDLDADLYQDYIDSGTVHILAISGLHVGIITMILFFLLKFLPQRGIFKWLRLIIIFVSLWGFAFVVGLSPSVMRAVAMFTFVSIALAFERRQGKYDSLMLSMLFLLLIQPNFLFNVGFQLSYAAVFSILFFNPKIEKIWQPKNKFLRYICSLLSLSIAAQLGVLPFSLYYFHQFSILFFIANIFVIPMLFPLIVLAIIVILWANIATVPTQLISILEKCISIMNSIVHWVSSKESFIFRNIYFDKHLLILSIVFLLISMYIFSKPKSYHRFIIFLSSIVIFQITFLYKKYWRDKRLEITVFHIHRNTLIGKLEGNHWQLYTNAEPPKYLIDNFSKSEGISQISSEKIPQLLNFHKQIIFVIDSLAIVPSQIQKEDIVILRQSPKINIERLLKDCPPKMIIADASNYPSYIARWKKTCKKYNVELLTTTDVGAISITKN